MHIFTQIITPSLPLFFQQNTTQIQKYLFRNTIYQRTSLSAGFSYPNTAIKQTSVWPELPVRTLLILLLFLWVLACLVLPLSSPSVPWHLTINIPVSPPVHRNMPKDQAMDFVATEYSRGLVKERPPRDPADIAAQASQLLDDFLDREKIERHTVPSETRPLLMLLAEGVHLYPEELETISEYVRSRQEHIQGGTLIKLLYLLIPFQSILVLSFSLFFSLSPASNTEGERGNMLPPGLGKPPPLLPTPPGPPQPQSGAGGPMMDHAPPPPSPLLPSPG